MNVYIMRKRGKRLIFHLAFYLLLIGLMYIFLFPLITIVIAAIQSPASADDPTVMWVPKELSLVPMKTAIELMQFWPAAGKSLLITLLSTLGTCFSCSLAAYGLARYRFTGKNLIFALAVLTIIVPPIILTNPAFIHFRYFDPLKIFSLTAPLTGYGSVNLLNTIWTFVFPAFLGVGLRGGLFIFIFRQFFLGMPRELEEAARIDGCGPLKTFLRVIVPLSIPVFITVILFSFIWHWNDYYYSASYFITGVRPLMVEFSDIGTGLYSAGLAGGTGTGEISGTGATAARSYIMAGALLTTSLPLLLYTFLQRYFVESVDRTGIVG